MKKKILVSYLFTKFDKEESINIFKKNYLRFSSGYDHDLLICFKMLDEKKIEYVKKNLDDLNYISFVDYVFKNDYDFGSYKRIAEKYPDRDIFFLNSHSYPVCNDWLNKLMKFKDNITLIGTSASNESLIDTLVLKKKYKIFSYLIKKLIYSKYFKRFPNPHIRTSSFLIYSPIFLDYMVGKKINTKFDAWKLESGKKSLTNYFKDKNYNILVVNTDGNIFKEKDWKLSETYNYHEKSKSIISDKHTRKYDVLSIDDKLISRKKVW
tara:strand:- start:922 stop:1719 length:798 start_codon:yes stop_codon:yes gene_type:complete